MKAGLSLQYITYQRTSLEMRWILILHYLKFLNLKRDTDNWNLEAKKNYNTNRSYTYPIGLAK
jgi:hypothetical protein